MGPARAMIGKIADVNIIHAGIDAVGFDKQAELLAIITFELALQHAPADRRRHIDRLGEMADVGFTFRPSEQLQIIAQRAEQEAFGRRFETPANGSAKKHRGAKETSRR